MSDEQPQQPDLEVKATQTQPITFTQMASDAIGIERIIAYGFLLVLLSTVGACLYLAKVNTTDKDIINFVLGYFKDISLILVGALSGFLVPRKKE